MGDKANVIKEAMLLEDNNFGTRDWKDRLLVLSRELGMLQQSLFYALLAKASGPEKAAHLANARKEMTDLIVQCNAFCIYIGWDFDECLSDGADEYLRKMQDYAVRLERDLRETYPCRFRDITGRCVLRFPTSVERAYHEMTAHGYSAREGD